MLDKSNENISSDSINIIPAFKENNIPIVFSCDDNYLTYLAVVLQSIKANSSKDCNYDICVLYDKLDKNLMQRIIHFIQNENFSLRFINISFFIKQAKQKIHFHTVAHFKEATYYRFFIPKIFKNFEKLIYMDLDMIVLKDLKELFLKDFKTPLAAVKEYLVILIVTKCLDLYYVDFIKTKKLIKNVKNYIQAGLLIYNIPECINLNFTQLCLDKLKELQDPPIVDQDVINSAFEDKITFLKSNWNYTWNLEVKYPNFESLLPKDLAKEASKAFKNPYIIHYNDIFKPWNCPRLPKAHLWWHYARQTPFYEEILYKNLKQDLLHLVQHKSNGAVLQTKSHLSYKLGNEILSIKNNPLKTLILPFTLTYIVLKHKFTKALLNLLSSLNPNLKPLPLNAYLDYNEALKVKKHLSYRLGNALLKNPFTFAFKVKKIYKEWKEEKDE